MPGLCKNQAFAGVEGSTTELPIVGRYIRSTSEGEEYIWELSRMI